MTARGSPGLFAGPLLGVRGADALLFFDWATGVLVRRLEVTPTAVYWAPSRATVVVATATDTFVLAFNAAAVDAALASGEAAAAAAAGDGLEDAFAVTQELPVAVHTGAWAGECVLYTDTGAGGGQRGA